MEPANSLFIWHSTHTVYSEPGNFIVAEVTPPLLGGNFLKSDTFLVDIKGKWLIDAATYYSAPLFVTSTPAP